MLAALAALSIALATPAHAACGALDDPATFIAQGAAAIERGEIKGRLFRAAEAMEIAAAVNSNKAELLALFYLQGNDGPVVIVVIAEPDNSATVCFGPATEALSKAVENYVGRHGA